MWRVFANKAMRTNACIQTDNEQDDDVPCDQDYFTQFRRMRDAQKATNVAFNRLSKQYSDQYHTIENLISQVHAAESHTRASAEHAATLAARASELTNELAKERATFAQASAQWAAERASLAAELATVHEVASRIVPERLQEHAERKHERDAWEAERHAREAAREAERQAREAEHATELQARNAKHEAELEARKAELQARKAELQARKAELQARDAKHAAKLRAREAEYDQKIQEFHSQLCALKGALSDATACTRTLASEFACRVLAAESKLALAEETASTFERRALAAESKLALAAKALGHARIKHALLAADLAEARQKPPRVEVASTPRQIKPDVNLTKLAATTKDLDVAAFVDYIEYLEAVVDNDEDAYYADRQNVHAPATRISVMASIDFLVRTYPDVCYSGVVHDVAVATCFPEDTLASWWDNEDMLNECPNATFRRVLARVWHAITRHAHRAELTRILGQNLSEAHGLCLQGRISRLVITLDGFVDGVRVEATVQEQVNGLALAILAEARSKITAMLASHKIEFVTWKDYLSL